MLMKGEGGGRGGGEGGGRGGGGGGRGRNIEVRWGGRTTMKISFDKRNGKRENWQEMSTSKRRNNYLGEGK